MAFNEYKAQLDQINILLSNNPDDDTQKTELLSLKCSIEELLTLADEPTTSIDDEYSLFVSEMAQEGAIAHQPSTSQSDEIESLKHLEGKKCRAPHTHQWGQTVYHNAMVSSVLSDTTGGGDTRVKVLFLNPTHIEMRPCPYFFESDSDCKFSDESCRYSHGEIVSYNSLREYVEPDFENLVIGSQILAKHKEGLWSMAKIRSIGSEHCLVQFDAQKKVEQVLFENIHPVEGDGDVKSSESEEEIHVENDRDVINMSLLIKPGDQALGDWEKYTRGIGSKLMQKMGYIVGTGLGKDSKGRIEPVTAVVLPPGKSLDHCMNLREKYGGDKNLFSAERKMKRLQKRREMLNKKAYERESQKRDVFSFMNATFAKHSQPTKEDIAMYKESLKKESVKNLNVTNLILRENIEEFERSVIKYKDAMKRITDEDGRKIILGKLSAKEEQLKHYQTYAVYVNNEQNLREQKRKMTEF